MKFRYISSFTLGRRGAVTPLTVLSLSLLVGVVALALDGGTLLESRRLTQAAADAAALAAANDLFVNYSANQGLDPSGTALASALSNAQANGFSNDGVNSTVTVRFAPQKYQSGSDAGQTIPAGYVEVIIQNNVSRLFSGVFGAGTTPLQARAVARGKWSAANNSLFLLNLKSSGALTMTGLSGLTVNGGILVNSNSASAIQLSSLLGITSSQLTVNPNAKSLINSLLSFLFGSGGSSPSVQYSESIPDPLRNYPVPDPVALGLSTQGTNLHVSGGTMDLYPGIYNGGIKVSGGSNVILHANSDGTPGIYYLQGQNGFSVSGPSSVTMASGETGGVMIYNNWQSASDSINLSGSGTITLSPPTSGVYKGMTIFQKRGKVASPGPTLNVSGSGSLNVTGTIYAAHAGGTFSGSGSAKVCGGQVILDSLSMSGSAIVNVDPGNQPIASTRYLGLVE